MSNTSLERCPLIQDYQAQQLTARGERGEGTVAPVCLSEKEKEDGVCVRAYGDWLRTS